MLCCSECMRKCKKKITKCISRSSDECVSEFNVEEKRVRSPAACTCQAGVWRSHRWDCRIDDSSEARSSDGRDIDNCETPTIVDSECCSWEEWNWDLDSFAAVCWHESIRVAEDSPHGCDLDLLDDDSDASRAAASLLNCCWYTSHWIWFHCSTCWESYIVEGFSAFAWPDCDEFVWSAHFDAENWSY